MSLLNFFEFLEDKEGREIPGRAKFLDPNYVFNVKDFEDKKGNVNLSGNPNLISIPVDNLTVEGNLNLPRCKNLQSLPDNLTVGGNLNLMYCINLRSLPDNLKVGRNIILFNCKSLRSLPDNLRVVNGTLDLMGCKNLQSLPDNLTTIKDSFYITDNPNIQSLPDNLTVGGNLYLMECKNLQSLPKDLKVGGDLYIRSTPIAEKYTKEQIKQMCPGVKGKIFGIKKSIK
jgi:hypothetical protein